MIYVITKWNERQGQVNDKVFSTYEKSREYIDAMNKEDDGLLYQMWKHEIE